MACSEYTLSGRPAGRPSRLIIRLTSAQLGLAGAWAELGTKEPVKQYEKEIKKIEHYEMWWNIWERRRGQRSTLEQSIEETEKERRMIQWETGNKGGEKETQKTKRLMGKEPKV